ncbi:MAG: MFS transporter [Myxococcales bacterium]
METDPRALAPTPPSTPGAANLPGFLLALESLLKTKPSLWLVGGVYTLGGFTYFALLSVLAPFLSGCVFRGASHAEGVSQFLLAGLTTGSLGVMVLLAFLIDLVGVRVSVIVAVGSQLLGFLLLAAGSTLFGPGTFGIAMTTVFALALIALGSGLAHPAAQLAARQFTSSPNASMSFALLYALMNLGGFAAMLAPPGSTEALAGEPPVRTFALCAGVLLLALVLAAFVAPGRYLSKPEATAPAAQPSRTGFPVTACCSLALLLVFVGVLAPGPWHWLIVVPILGVVAVIALLPGTLRTSVVQAIQQHPLADPRFALLVFALMPVQTLFTYNWLVLPRYVMQAYPENVSDLFEKAVNAESLAIVLLVVGLTAFTYKVKTIHVIIGGTLVMALAPFALLVTSPLHLAGYLVLTTIGEAIWSPRVLQYVSDIAPPERQALYQGAAQLPWYLTKTLVPVLYVSAALSKYLPANGPSDPSTMWLLFGLLAMSAPVVLLLARRRLLPKPARGGDAGLAPLGSTR